MKYHAFYLAILAAGSWLLLTSRPPFDRRDLRLASFAILSIVMAVFLWRVTVPGTNYVDFTAAYYDAGRLIFENPDALFLGKLPEFVNLPVIAPLFTPLSVLEEGRAVEVLIFLSVLVLLLTWFLIWRSNRFDEAYGLKVAWLIITSGAIFYSLRLGNATHFLLPLILAILLLHRRLPLVAGIAAAFCALIKLPLMLVGVYFVMRRQWKLAIGFWLAIMVGVALSVVLFGWDIHVRWYEETIGRHSGKVVGAYNVQSVNGFLAHLRPENHLYNWFEDAYGLKFRLMRIAALAAIALPWLFVLWRTAPPKNERDFQLEFGATLCVCLLASPITWIHYYAILLVPVALLIREPFDARWKSLALLFSLVLMALPVVHTLPDVVAPKDGAASYLFRHLLVSHYFFGGLLLLGLLLYERYWRGRRLSASPARQVAPAKAG